MEDKRLTGEESLDLITKMISTAKHEIEDDSFFYLLWGWLVFISCLAHFIMIRADLPYQGISWAVLMPLGGVVSLIYGIRMEKRSRVKTYIDEIMKYVIIAFVFCLIVILGFMSRLGLSTYPMILLIYGIWLFVSGGALQFRPLIIGGILNWILAVVAFFVGFEQQLIVLGVAVLFGYIIPGHLLKNRFSRKGHKVITE